MKTIIKYLFLFTLTITLIQCDQIKSLLGEKEEPTPPPQTTTETKTETETKKDNTVESQTSVVVDEIKAKPDATTFVVGEKVMVHWGKKWWSAKVLKVDNNRFYVSYDGYKSSWDEWVGLDRIKKK